MVLKNETGWYITLSIVCFIFIIVLTIFSPQGSFKHSMVNPTRKITHSIKPSNHYDKQLKDKLSGGEKSGIKISFEGRNLTPQNMAIFGLLSLLYTALFIFGVVNLFIFIAKAINKKPFSKIVKVPQSFSVSNKNISMLIFGITYLYLAMYLISFALMPKGKMNYNYFLIIFTALSVVFYTFIIASVLKVIPFKNLGIRFSAKYIIYSIRMYSATAVVILLTALILFQIQKIFHIHFNAQPMVYVIAALKEKWLLAILISEIVILAPISEELLFRGVIYNYLKKYLRWGYAAFLTSLLFAFLHANLFGFFIIFIISMVICYIYEKSNNIITAFLFHSLHNTLSIANILILKHLIT